MKCVHHLWEHNPLDSLCIVIVPVRDVALSGREVRADEAHGRRVVTETDCHGTLKIEN